MMFNVGKRWTHGYRRWFAWFPVPIAPYEGQWAWWEYVEREPDCYAGGITGYQYRLPSTKGEQHV
jgi:hypothetical protein